jgi:hypothetical protein
MTLFLLKTKIFMNIKQFLVYNQIHYKILRHTFNEFYRIVFNDLDTSKQVRFRVFLELNDNECIPLSSQSQTLYLLEDCAYFATYYQLIIDLQLNECFVKTIIFVYEIEDIEE